MATTDHELLERIGVAVRAILGDRKIAFVAVLATPVGPLLPATGATH